MFFVYTDVQCHFQDSNSFFSEGEDWPVSKYSLFSLLFVTEFFLPFDHDSQNKVVGPMINRLVMVPLLIQMKTSQFSEKAVS